MVKNTDPSGTDKIKLHYKIKSKFTFFYMSSCGVIVRRPKRRVRGINAIYNAYALGQTSIASCLKFFLFPVKSTAAYADG